MKKVLTLTLALLMALTMLPIHAYAKVLEPVSIAFAYKYDTDAQLWKNMNGEFEKEKDRKWFVYYYTDSYSEGNTVTVTYSNGDTEVYTCQEMKVENGWTAYRFANSEGKLLGGDGCVEITSEQTYENRFKVGKNYLNVYCPGLDMECKTPIYVNDLPQSMSFTIPAKNEIFYYENSYGYFDTDSKGKKYFYYSIEDMYEEFSDLSKKGNKVTFTYKNGSKDTFTYKEINHKEKDGDDEWIWTERIFVNADKTKRFPASYLTASTDQRTNHWKTGTNYITVSFGTCKKKLAVKVKESPVKNITFSWNTPFTVKEKTNGSYNYDDKNKKYYEYEIEKLLRKHKHTLTVHYKDGKSVKYTYQKFRYGDNKDDYYYSFFDAKGNELSTDYKTQYYFDGVQYEKHWGYGVNNETFRFLGKSCQIPVEIAPAKDSWQKIGADWYYYKSLKRVTGWQQLSGKWYYFNASGVMQTGWQQLSGKWYYFNTSGVMQTGWQKLGGKWYYFDASGAMQTGWQKLGGKWYYFESSGEMVAGTSKKIGSKTYRFDANGVCLNP